MFNIFGAGIAAAQGTRRNATTASPGVLQAWNTFLAAPAAAAGALAASSGLLTGVQRSLGAVWNRTNPNLAPGISDIMTAYYRGFLDPMARGNLNDDLLRAGMLAHGVSFNPLDGRLGLVQSNGGWDPFWRAVKDTHYPWPSPDVLHWLFVMGLIDEDSHRKLMIHCGHGDPRVIATTIDRFHPLSLEEAMYRYGAFADGSIGPNGPGYTRQLKLNGTLPARDNGVALEMLKTREALASGVSTSIATSALWRGLWNAPQYRDYLRRNGAILDLDTTAATLQSTPIPGVEQIIDMISSGCLNPAKVTQDRLDDGFIPLIGRWLAWHGCEWADTEAPIPGGGAVPTWSQLLWRAHWRDVNDAQAIRAGQRLTPRGTLKWQKVVGPGVRQWTMENVREQLVENGVAPGIVDTVISLGYSPLGLRGVQRVMRVMINNPPAVGDMLADYGGPVDTPAQRLGAFANEQARDAGMAPPDADLIGKVTTMEAEQKIALPGLRRVAKANESGIKQIIALYVQGLYGKDRATTELMGRGVQDVVAWDMLDQADRTSSMNDMRTMIGRIRHDYFAGEYTTTQAYQLLLTTGIVPDRASQYTLRWQMVFHRKRRILETGKIQQMVREGLMSIAAATVRLANLGWTQNDIILLEAETVQRVASDTKRIQTITARQLAANAKMQAATLKATRAQLAKMEPPSRLQRLFADGKIDANQLRQSLTAQGWTERGIATLILDTPHGKNVSKADLAAMFKADIITEDEWRGEMGILGYDSYAIENEWALLNAAVASGAG